MRDGLIAGLILSGHDVKDHGLRAPAAPEHAALVHADGDGYAITFILARRALTGDALLELASLADGDDFAAGEGSLELV